MNGFSMDQVTNFSVKIRLEQDSYLHLLEGEGENAAPFRPGMSATVDILTARRSQVLSVPIQAVASRAGTASDEATGTSSTNASDATLGVFLFKDGKALWTPVETGIQDTKYIEVVGELDTSNVLVTGPYDIVSRTLNSGDAVDAEKH